MCKTRILSQKGRTAIAQCIGCGNIHICHQSLMFRFEEDDFGAFVHRVNGVDFVADAILFPDGSERAVIHSPDGDVSFNLRMQEFLCFRETLREARHMQRVYELMK